MPEEAVSTRLLAMHGKYEFVAVGHSVIPAKAGIHLAGMRARVIGAYTQYGFPPTRE